MRKFKSISKCLVLFFFLVILFSIVLPVDLSANDVCEYALIHCIGGADLGEWLSRAIVGQILYCLNGYDFCKTYYEPYLM